MKIIKSTTEYSNSTSISDNVSNTFNKSVLLNYLHIIPDIFNDNITYLVNGLPKQYQWTSVHKNKNEIIDYIKHNSDANGAAFKGTKDNNLLFLDADSSEAAKIKNLITGDHKTLTWYGTKGHETSVYTLSEKMKPLFVDVKKFKIFNYENISTNNGPLEVTKIGLANCPYSFHAKSGGIYHIINDSNVAQLPDEIAEKILSLKHVPNKIVEDEDEDKDISPIFEKLDEVIHKYSIEEIFIDFVGLENFRKVGSQYKSKNPFFTSNTGKNLSFSIYDSYTWTCYKSQISSGLPQLLFYIDEVKKFKNDEKSESEIIDFLNNLKDNYERKKLIPIVKKILEHFNEPWVEEEEKCKISIPKLSNTIEVESIEKARYLTEQIYQTNKNLIACLKAPMGSGKTQHYAIKLIEKNTLLLFSNISLGLESCRRTEAIWHSDFEGKKIKSRFGSTLDSLHKYVDYLNPDCILLDEILNILNHLIFGNTDIKHNRTLIFSICIKLIEMSKITLCLDAYLDDTVIKFLKAYFPTKNFLIMNYSPVPVNRILNSYTDKEHFLISIKKDIVNANETNRFAYVSDSKESCNFVYKLAIAELEKKGINNPSKQILLITSDTSKKEDIVKALRNLDSYILENNIIALIFSPSIKSGVSIELDSFQKVYLESNAVLFANDTMQLVSRIRNKNSVELFVNNVITEPTPTVDTILKRLVCGINNTVQDNDVIELTKMNLTVDLTEEEAFEFLLSLPPKDLMQRPELIYYAEQVQKHIRDKHNWKEVLHKYFKQIGFSLNVISEKDDSKNLSKLVKEHKEEVKQSNAKLIFQGLKYREDKLNEIIDENNRKKIEYGIYIQRSFPNKEFSFEEIDYCVNQNKDFIKRIKLCNKCFNYYAYLKYESNLLTKIGLNSRNNLEFSPQEIAFSAPTVKLISNLGIRDYIDDLKNNWYSNDSEFINKIYEKCLENKELLYVVFNLRSDKNPSRLVNNILKRLGFPIVNKQVRVNNKNQRFYKIALKHESNKYKKQKFEIELFYNLMECLDNVNYITDNVHKLNKQKFEEYINKQIDSLVNSLNNNSIDIDEFQDSMYKLDSFNLKSFVLHRKKFLM